MNEEHPVYISTAMAGEILGISQEAVSAKIRQGRLPGIRIGRTWAIPRNAVIDFAKDYVKGPGPLRSRSDS